MIFFSAVLLIFRKKKQNKIQHSVSSPLLCNMKIKSLFFVLWILQVTMNGLFCEQCVCHVCVTTLCPKWLWLQTAYWSFISVKGSTIVFSLVWTIDLTGWGIYYCLYNFLKPSEIFVSARIHVGLLYHSCLTFCVWIPNSYILSYSYIFICY